MHRYMCKINGVLGMFSDLQVEELLSIALGNGFSSMFCAGSMEEGESLLGLVLCDYLE